MKECSQYIYISVILIDSVYIRNKNFYPQVVLEKYKYVVKKKRSYFITDYIKIYSDDSNDSDDSDKKTQMKTIKYINLFLKETRII